MTRRQLPPVAPELVEPDEVLPPGAPRKPVYVAGPWSRIDLPPEALGFLGGVFFFFTVELPRRRRRARKRKAKRLPRARAREAGDTGP